MTKAMLDIYLKDKENKVIIEIDNRYYDIENNEKIEVIIQGGEYESKI